MLSGGSKGGGARDTPRLGVQILSISCSFWENLAKSSVGAPGELAPPPRGNPGSATDTEQWPNGARLSSKINILYIVFQLGLNVQIME